VAEAGPDRGESAFENGLHISGPGLFSVGNVSPGRHRINGDARLANCGAVCCVKRHHHPSAALLVSSGRVTRQADTEVMLMMLAAGAFEHCCGSQPGAEKNAGEI